MFIKFFSYNSTRLIIRLIHKSGCKFLGAASRRPLRCTPLSAATARSAPNLGLLTCPSREYNGSED